MTTERVDVLDDELYPVFSLNQVDDGLYEVDAAFIARYKDIQFQWHQMQEQLQQLQEKGHL